MNATAFDTLRFANRVTATGMAHSQAACLAETLADTLIVDPGTRSDLARLETALRDKIRTLRAETHAAIANAKVALLRRIVPLNLAQIAMILGLCVKLGW
jgi:hypothetical protein